MKRLLPLLMLLLLPVASQAQQLHIYCNHLLTVPCTTNAPLTPTNLWDPPWLMGGKAENNFNILFSPAGLGSVFNVSGLMLGAGLAAPTAYTGTACSAATFLTALNGSGVATCLSTLTSASTSILNLTGGWANGNPVNLDQEQWLVLNGSAAMEAGGMTFSPSDPRMLTMVVGTDGRPAIRTVNPLTITGGVNTLGPLFFGANAKISVNGGTGANDGNLVFNSGQFVATGLVCMGSAASASTCGNESLRVTNVVSGVNQVQVAGATTTNSPTISAIGADTNIGLSFFGKGTGGAFFGSPVTVGTSGATQPMQVNGTLTVAKGGLVVSTPTSGAAMSVSGFQTSGVAVLTSGNTGANQVADLSVTRNGSTINAIGKGPNIQLTDLSTAQNATLIQNSGGQTEFYQNNASTWTRFAHTDTSDNFYVDAGFGNAGTAPFLGVTVGPGTHFLCYSSSTHQISAESTVACGGVTSPPNYSSGTFSGTFTDGTNTVVANVYYVIVGNMAEVTFPAVAHLNAPVGTTFTMTGLPASLQPGSNSQMAPIANLVMENNGATINSASVQVVIGSGTLTFWNVSGSGGWSGAGARGFTQGASTTWNLQ